VEPNSNRDGAMKRKDRKMLEACRGELCYVNMPGICIGGTETVVPAHSNELVHGKGMGIKAYDFYTVPACYACHYELDQGRSHSKQEKKDFWRLAFERWEPVRDRKLNAKPAALTAGKTKAEVTGAATPRSACY